MDKIELGLAIVGGLVVSAVFVVGLFTIALEITDWFECECDGECQGNEGGHQAE